jgi:DNA-binding transcriptional MocR family regulator
MAHGVLDPRERRRGEPLGGQSQGQDAVEGARHGPLSRGRTARANIAPVSAPRTSPRLDALPRYEPGLTSAEVLARHALASAVKLSSNESPFAPLPEVAEAIARTVAGLNRYPDRAARDLRRALAERHGVGPDQVAVGNGSCELILLAGQALLDPGTTVVHADPSFAMYPHLAPAAGAEARCGCRWPRTAGTTSTRWPPPSTSARAW